MAILNEEKEILISNKPKETVNPSKRKLQQDQGKRSKVKKTLEVADINNNNELDEDSVDSESMFDGMPLSEEVTLFLNRITTNNSDEAYEYPTNDIPSPMAFELDNLFTQPLSSNAVSEIEDLTIAKNQLPSTSPLQQTSNQTAVNSVRESSDKILDARNIFDPMPLSSEEKPGLSFQKRKSTSDSTITNKIRQHIDKTDTSFFRPLNEMNVSVTFRNKMDSESIIKVLNYFYHFLSCQPENIDNLQLRSVYNDLDIESNSCTFFQQFTINGQQISNYTNFKDLLKIYPRFDFIQLLIDKTKEGKPAHKSGRAVQLPKTVAIRPILPIAERPSPVFSNTGNSPFFRTVKAVNSDSVINNNAMQVTENQKKPSK